MMWSPLNLEVISRYSSFGRFRMRHRKHFPIFQKKSQKCEAGTQGKTQTPTRRCRKPPRRGKVEKIN